jgi:phosphoserine phosphatase RsbU/P
MPAARSKLQTHAPAYFGLALLFVLAFASWAQDSFWNINEIWNGVRVVGDPFTLDNLSFATGLRPEATAAGVREGDIVLSVNGRALQGYSDYYVPLRLARPGDRLDLRIRTNDANGTVEKNVSIALPTVGSTVDTYIVLLIAALQLFCLALGFWVAAVRIGDRSAWLLLAMMLGLANFIGGNRRTMFSDGSLQPLLTAFYQFAANLAPTALVFFIVAFPDRLAFDRKYPWVKWVVFGPLLFHITTSALLVGMEGHHLDLVAKVWNAHERLKVLGNLHLFAVVVFFVILGYRTATASDRDARRRLFLLAGAAAVSFIPVMISIGLRFADVGWTTLVVVALFLIFPLTMAYVIVVHRAMDVRVAIRQGLQYLLAAGSVRALQFVLGAAIVVGATLLSANFNTPRRLTATGLGITLIFILRTVSERLRGWVDRRFFREAYEADVILGELATKVRTIVETGPLLETVASRIAQSLHVPRIAILLDGGGRFVPAYALGYPTTPAVTIPEESVTVKRLRKQQHALVQFDDEDSWVQLTEGAERASLEELKPELLLPLSLNEKLLGIMSLGAKQSEEPFSRTDIRLLDSVAAQTGLALENGRLTAAITAEVAAREKQKRELEIAHEVQERLFPQEYPPIPGLDYAGACRPALDVGGDYYDFIALSKRELGIAIGDVSGKGIPAALLMATLRAFLRGQTLQRQSDLTAVMANLNKLVFESSTSNRYATFFYGEFDAATRVLTYVNGGHNPPMLFRHSDGGRDVVRLDAGGPVIGLMEDCFYQQASVALEAGDVLVAYTDGISEAMNEAEDEWGEERLMHAVRPNRAAPTRELIDRLMKSADAFVAGAPQHDDMTLVILRMT